MTKIEKKNFGRVIAKEFESSKTQDLNVKGSIKKLMFSHNETIEDKIATVKAAQLIDKGQFETAFKKLMKR